MMGDQRRVMAYGGLVVVSALQLVSFGQHTDITSVELLKRFNLEAIGLMSGDRNLSMGRVRNSK